MSCSYMKKVSVIIPTYSRPDNLLRAIDSVLKQTYKEIEIIVVDDNGIGTLFQQETEKKIKHWIDAGTITYIRHKINKNGSAARNSGLQIFSGEYFTFLDDDDYLYPSKIEKQVQALENNEEYDIVYCGHEKKGVSGVILSKKIPHLEGNLQLLLLKRTWGFGSGSDPLFRRRVFERVGFFDAAYIRHQDVEYMVRAFRYFKICVVPEVLMTRYVDSKTNRPSVDRYISVKEKFLSDFKEDISKFCIREQRKVYRNNWYEIALMSIAEDKSKGWEYFKKSNSYTLLSFKQMLKFMAYFVLNKKYGR